ncbi:MAG: hypothetical protein KJ621_05540 [Proteobacteria bacterium]|nr:hypothetical protein [Pseudomonadota bacterium]
MTGQEYFIWTLAALIIAGVLQFLLTRWWLGQSRKIDPDICDQKHGALNERLEKGDQQFGSIILGIERTDARFLAIVMILIRICNALNILLPKDQRIPCDDLIDTLRKT